MTGAIPLPHMRRPRLSPTLTGYITRQFTSRILVFLLGLAGIIVLLTLVDLLRRFATTEHVPIEVVLEMAFLRLPHLLQEAMPLILLCAGMATFWRLTRTYELVVTRAAGISVWHYLLPVAAIALLLGTLTSMVLNPLGSALNGRLERLEAQHLEFHGELLSVSRNGLWLRQSEPEGQSVIHAQKVAAETMTLYDVTVYRIGDDDRFEGRIDATRAELFEGRWRLSEAWKSGPESRGRFVGIMELPTSLTTRRILDSFSSPHAISFWKLPGFIRVLEQAGFSSQRHRVYWHRLLAIPLLLTGMVVLGAAFALRPPRLGKVGVMLFAGLSAGFVLHALSNLVSALGLSGKIPTLLAGWGPAGISVLLGIALLFHLEDG